MLIEIDFDVFKALTSLRKGEEDTYNDVLHRLLHISESISDAHVEDPLQPVGPDVIARLLAGLEGSGVWMGNVFFPEGTKFRATYKGKTFRAQIKDETWIDENGVARQSPSEAAGAISGTKVNGWRFWYAMRPNDDDWHRLDEFRK